MDLTTLTADQILSVYSGEQGCTCGCQGRHYYNPKYQKEGGEVRGYAVENDEVSLPMVARVLEILRRTSAKIERGAGWISADIGSRRYIIYLAQPRVP